MSEWSRQPIFRARYLISWAVVWKNVADSTPSMDTFFKVKKVEKLSYNVVGVYRLCKQISLSVLACPQSLVCRIMNLGLSETDDKNGGPVLLAH